MPYKRIPKLFKLFSLLATLYTSDMKSEFIAKYLIDKKCFAYSAPPINSYKFRILRFIRIF